MSEEQKQAKPKRRHHVAEVVESRALTPQMLRIVLGGPGLRDFGGVGEFTDHYVKLQLPPADSDYSPPFDPEQIKATRPREMWPRTRTYTVRDWDGENCRLTLDILHHGEFGVAGPWALAARPGDSVQLVGPGGGYRPDPAAAWHLMVGDEAVLPAIAVSLAHVPDGVPVYVVAEVDGPEDELPLQSPGQLALTWLHRRHRSGEASSPLLAALDSLDFPSGPVHAFIHGEADMVRAVRRYLVRDRRLPKEALSASGYWRQSRSDEDWRSEKPEWKRLAAADLAG